MLVPRPHVNLVLYHGVLAPRAAWRRAIVPTPARPGAVGSVEATNGAPDGLPTGRGWRWAALMQRVFALDVLACPRCGGRLRLVALLDASAVTVRILRHLGLPDTVPPPLPRARLRSTIGPRDRIRPDGSTPPHARGQPGVCPDGYEHCTVTHQP